MKNNPLYFYYWAHFILIIGATLFSPSVLAEPFDHQYLAWKAQQELHDQRLSREKQSLDQQPTPMPSEDVAVVKTKQVAAMTDVKSALVMVSLNQANEKQLQQLKGIGERKARAIIEYRQQHGMFKHIEELKQVKGIGENIYLKNQAQLSL